MIDVPPGVLLGSQTLFTEDGGYATIFWNKTGSKIPRGTVCACSPYVDTAIVFKSDGLESLGVALQDIEDGASGWLVTAGVVRVLLIDETASYCGGIVKVEAFGGRVRVSRKLKRSGKDKVVGLCLEKKAAGIDTLVKIQLHFL